MSFYVSNNMEDRELIRKFLEGEKGCFDELILRYQGMVFNLCKKMLGNYEEALDVSQDIFLKLYESIESFRHEAKFSTYLYRITLNFCKNRLRSLRRYQKSEAFCLDDPIDTAEGEVKRELASKDPSPRDNLEAKEKQKVILNALEALKEEYKEIIVLKEIEGLKYEDIAEILGIDLGTVKSRLSRAREALKQNLEGVL